MADSTLTVTIATKDAAIVGDWAARETIDVTIAKTSGAFAAGTYTLALVDDSSTTLLSTTDAGGGSVALTLAAGELTGSIDLNTTEAVAVFDDVDRDRGHRTLRLYLWEALTADLIIADDITVDWTGYYAGMTSPSDLTVDYYTKAQIDGLLALYTATASLGDLATQDTINNSYWSGVDLSILNGGSGSSTAAGARTNFGLEIDVDVQAYDAGLASAAAFPTAANKMLYSTAADTWAEGDITAAGRAVLDDASALAQRGTLEAAASQPPEGALGNISGANAIVWTQTTQSQTCTLTNDTQFTEGAGWPAAGNSAAVDITIDNGGAHTVTWTLVGATNWLGTAPSGAGVYELTFWKKAGVMWASGVVGSDGT